MSEQNASDNTVQAGAIIEPGVVLESGIFIGHNAVLLASDGESQATLIEHGCVIGANATIYPGVKIGQSANVKPGAVVQRSVPPFAIVDGNPAKVIGYVNAAAGNAQTSSKSTQRHQPDVVQSIVKGVTLNTFRAVPDIRGSLSVGEFEREIPFAPLRYFLVYDVPTAETRGEHAHVTCHQFLVAVKGCVSVVADDGQQREEFMLNQPNLGLYLPPMTWGIQYQYSSDAVLLVFASHYYAQEDYIRDYGEFLDRVKKKAM